MYLARVAVCNHARVCDLELDIRRHLVIVGANDTGKTTLLRCLDALLGATSGQLHAWMTPDVLRDRETPLVIEGTLKGLREVDHAAFADEIELVDQGNGDFDRQVTVRLVVTIDPDDPDAVLIERRFVKGVAEHRHVAHQDLARLGWAYLPATRSPDQELGGSRRGAVRALLGSVELGEDADTVRSALQGFRDSVQAAASLEQIRVDVARALVAVYPAEAAPDSITIELPHTSDGDLLGDVDLHLERGAVRVPLSEQSDGLRALTTLALQRLARTQAQMVAIDEPELHLHPRSQSRLAAHLAAGPGQVVLATHSPQVVAAFSPEDVVVMTSEGNTRRFADRNRARLRSFAEQYWLDSALEPLTARGLVLVEGVCDRIVVRAAARALGKDLDGLGWSVVAVHGAPQFKPALHLFGPGGFDVPAVLLVDEAEFPIVGTQLGCDLADAQTHGVQVCHRDLEDECIRGLGPEAFASLLLESGLFSEEELLAGCRVSGLASLGADELYKWATRDGVKVKVAVALARTLDDAQAAHLGAVTALLGALGP